MPRGQVGKECPFCQAPMMPGVRASVCSMCGRPHHAECWAQNGGCSTHGCTGGEAIPEAGVRQEHIVALKPVAVVSFFLLALALGVIFAFPSLRYSGLIQFGDIKINPKDGAEMVWVPAGEFLMGSNLMDADEKPQHTVYLDGFWMYKYEVTVAQYRKFCDETGRSMPDAPEWGWKENHPVINVTWQGAADYAKWAGARLPTEAEWEKAARGTNGRTYPWGNDWDASKCAYGKGTQPVGSYPAGVSPYGCMDMAGNVCEWCADWWDLNYYSQSPARNPQGPASGRYRVLRGGGWLYGVDDSRCASRNFYFTPYLSCYNYGFRLAR